MGIDSPQPGGQQRDELTPEGQCDGKPNGDKPYDPAQGISECYTLGKHRLAAVPGGHYPPPGSRLHDPSSDDYEIPPEVAEAETQPGDTEPPEGTTPDDFVPLVQAAHSQQLEAWRAQLDEEQKKLAQMRRSITPKVMPATAWPPKPDTDEKSEAPSSSRNPELTQSGVIGPELDVPDAGPDFSDVG